jgi:hypothetical protein
MKTIQSAIAIAIMAFSLGGCLTDQAQEPPGAPITLSAEQVKQIQSGVLASLKDPDSAKFSGPMVATKKSNDDIHACGLVNAKNSYGGYVGDSPYIATLRDGKVIDTATKGGDDAFWIIKICKERGVPL